MAEDEDNVVKEEQEAIPFVEFLESTPPSTLTRVTQLVNLEVFPSGVTRHLLSFPEIQLHCPNSSCNGTRFFRCNDRPVISIPITSFEFSYISYTCSNCRVTNKTYSLASKTDESGKIGQCYKFGEFPVYGPPTSARLISLIGPDRDVFLKGRRCENQGLGIGAFVYYRRVVENQKNRILDEIIKVSEKLSVSRDKIETLKNAKSETQFNKAVKSVRDAIPESLLINGHNPITLLHSALSEGLHDRDDEQCLQVANSIRVILGELSERLAHALKDEAELTQAISKLLKVKDS